MAKRATRRESPPRPSQADVREGTSEDRAPAALMDNELENEPQPISPDQSSDPNSLRPEAIARRAYEIYCEQGCEDGRAMDHWLQAEQELRTRR